MQDNDEAGPDALYFRYLEQGRFMIQRCRKTGRHVFYPRVAEPGTGNDLEWVEASGRGIVYSTTVVRQKIASESYNVSLIDLAEGPRLMSRVIGVDPGEVAIGMAVEAYIGRSEEQPVLLFRPTQSDQ